jgi:hypothetical protein
MWVYRSKPEIASEKGDKKIMAKAKPVKKGKKLGSVKPLMKPEVMPGVRPLMNVR